jgi:hypothetical protein
MKLIGKQSSRAFIFSQEISAISGRPDKLPSKSHQLAATIRRRSNSS